MTAADREPTINNPTGGAVETTSIAAGPRSATYDDFLRLFDLLDAETTNA